jgi:hypothetical protein
MSDRTGCTTEEDLGNVQTAINGLVEADILAPTILGEHFCNDLKIGILL